jgi:hypothetical protein
VFWCFALAAAVTACVVGVCRQFAIVFLFEILSCSIRSNSNK